MLFLSQTRFLIVDIVVFATKLDFAKVDDPKVAALLAMQVLLIDEFSMLDQPIFESLAVRIPHPHGHARVAHP